MRDNMPKGFSIKYTTEQLDFIKSNRYLSRKEITEKVNIKFNTNFTVRNIEYLCTRNKWSCGRTGQFSKGNIPYNKGTKRISKSNKTSFKKGHNTWIKKPIGYECNTRKTGYIFVKTENVKSFISKHRLVWEQHNGPVPKGYIVAFKNMNKKDCRIENLILMSKSEMARYCHSFRKLATQETNETCLLMAKVKSRTHQVIKGGAS
jgi:hypothetical protein